MKKLVLAIVIIFTGMRLNAQSISFSDLTNLTNLSDGQAHTYLSLGGIFKLDYMKEENGKKIEYFRSKSAKVAPQSITIGVNEIQANGTILRTVLYTTQDPENIVNLIAQAKRAKLIMKFQGMDRDNNIYKFDNEFYNITMLISTNNNKGSVEVKQKEFIGY
ncbi:hypothetical protein FPZ42_14825 [Mucilaginibacter achroorhodeus]|uniref:DUF4252 domain-containing protein n=1 Tax=Mucilaginibacter achroorhodeus TaxID=2599294 RepID=A0A563U2B9_9SPHI|nr:hypothetical protein [Mucilaginibacter achroorhodeus]TWR25019.1 hypothetical protein FPZ42_14825 [Mucilaginibacter achroorhodeus]